MLKIKAQVKDINYDTLIELFMPYLVAWLSDQDNKFYGLVSKLISKEGKPNRLSRFIVSALPKKTELAVRILPHFDDMLMEYINNQLDKNLVFARVKELKAETIVRSSRAMLRIEFVIDEVDYEKTSDNLLPIILQQLSEKEDQSSKLPRILMSMKRLPRQVLGAAVRAIPKEQRDEVTSIFLNEYKEELTALVNTLLIQNNIQAEVRELNVDTK